MNIKFLFLFVVVSIFISVYFTNNIKVTILNFTDVIKLNYKNLTKTKSASIVITVEITPDYEKDYEIIPSL